MFSTNFIFRQQENLVDNQKCQAGFRPLCNKIPLRGSYFMLQICHAKGFKMIHIRSLFLNFYLRYSLKCLKILENVSA